MAVDIGGTQMRAACYPSQGLVPLNLKRTSTQAPGSTPVERLIGLIESIWPSGDAVEAIGVAAPGPIEPYSGIVLSAPNIPGWTDMPLRAHLEEHFHVPVLLGNDANLAAVGEWQFGAGKGHHHLIYITISTGIGGGIIINDQLLLGYRGLAAEIGHVTVMQDGPMCGCGQRGHLESVASGPAIARWVTRELEKGTVSQITTGSPINAKTISDAAKAGDCLALAALERAGTFIGQAIANYLHIFNPSIIILGGGVSRSGDLLLNPIYASMKKHVMTHDYLTDLVLTTASLGDEVGLMGALALARSHSKT